MTRGPLFQEGYRPQLSGHETFPLRYGWLKKAFDAVQTAEKENTYKNIFSEEAIARFGVGKNMVSSIKYWAEAAGIIAGGQGSQVIHPTELGRSLFGARGWDPFLEHPASLWMIHWRLSAHPERTTWFWAFSYYPSVFFEREHMLKALERLAKERSWPRASTATIKNDVACFVRTYVALQTTPKAGHEDTLESPLTELGLIKAVGKRGGFRFVRGPKTTLPDGVFAYALIDFWARVSPKTATLSFEAIAHEAGSPGRVFLLDENDVIDRLAALDHLTEGKLRWSETAGLKQVVRNGPLHPGQALKYVQRDYASGARREAA